MSELSVEDLVERFQDLRKQDLDLAIRNLADTLLSMLEFKELGRKVYESEFWSEAKEDLLNLDDVKSLRLSDIIFFKDPVVRKKVLKFFSQIMEGEYDFHREVSEWVRLFDWLDFFSECKVREFRNFATTIGLTLYRGILSQISRHIIDIRGSKAKVGDSIIAMIKVLCKYYHCKLVNNRLKDIDVSIRSLVLDHIMDALTDKLYLAVDEAVVMTSKKNNNKSLEALDMIKQGPLTKTAVNWLAKGLAEGTAERVAKMLSSIPHSLGKMIIEVETNPAKEWDSKGHDCLDLCVGVLKKHTPLLIKSMAEDKEEIGVHIINFFLAAEKEQPLFSKFLEGENLQIVCSMVTSRKKKLAEAASEFILCRIEERGTEEISKREEIERITRLTKILEGIDNFKAARRFKEYEFDEDETIATLEKFSPKLVLQFDGRVVADLFLNDTDLNQENEVKHLQAYSGCLLQVILTTCDQVSGDKLQGNKQYEGLKGEGAESIKLLGVQLRTQIKEIMKKALSGKMFREPECLRVYLKILKLCLDGADEQAQSLLTNLYDRSVDKKILREIARILRELYESSRSSNLAHKVFSEQITQLYDSQLATLNSAVLKLKSETTEKGVESVNKNHKLIDELRICFRKVSPLKNVFQVQLGQKIDIQLQDNLTLVLDLFVADKLQDREILEHAIIILHARVAELVKLASTQSDGVAQIVKEGRNAILEYLMYFLEQRSLDRFSQGDATSIRRFVFMYLVETLKTISADLMMDKDIIYFKPDDNYLNRIWDFVDSYLFGVEHSGQGEYELTSEEKKKARAMDGEEPQSVSNQKTEGKNRRSVSRGINEPDKVVTLRLNTLKFREDASVLVVMVFKLSYWTLRSIGMSLATRLILRLLSLESHQQLFLPRVETLFEALVDMEKQQTTVGRLIFWRLVKNCIDHYDLGSLKKLSKLVFSFYKKYSSDTVMIKNKYHPFCMSIIQGAQESSSDPQAAQKALLFIKKSLLDQDALNKMLYFMQYTLDTMRKEASDLAAEASIVASPKYLVAQSLRNYMADLCNKQIKDDPDETNNNRSRRVSKSLTKNKNSKMDAEDSKDFGNMPVSELNQENKPKGKTLKIKGKKVTNLKIEQEEEREASRENSVELSIKPQKNKRDDRQDEEEAEVVEAADNKNAKKKRGGKQGKK